MKERPILFSGPMVSAILEGRKTMTRRVVKLPDWFSEEYSQYGASEIFGEIECPYGRLGDRLWVRETWQTSKAYDPFLPSQIDPAAPVRWLADGACRLNGPEDWGRVRSSIHMPRWACRLWLEVEATRVERVQDITEADAKAEGVVPIPGTEGNSHSYRWPFCLLWDSINAARGFGWDVNPWVWVIEFKRMEQESAQ